MTDVVDGHTWRPGNSRHIQHILRLERPCVFAGCGRSNAEHVRSRDGQRCPCPAYDQTTPHMCTCGHAQDEHLNQGQPAAGDFKQAPPALRCRAQA
jgi:hypothetical protein